MSFTVVIIDIDLSVVKTKFLFNSPQLATQDMKR